MARKSRKKPFEAIIILLLTTILLALVIMIALMLHQMGYLEKLKLPDLPFLEELGIHLPVSDKNDPVPYTEGQVKVCFIDVEQGDSTLIIAPEATVLIDGGTPAHGSTVYSLLKEQGIGHLDYIINTHPHSDHVGGLVQVVKKLGSGGVEKVLITAYPDHLEPDIQSWPDLLQNAKTVGAEIETAQPDTVLELGENAALTILGPTKLYDDMNDDSIVCRLDFGTASFLFTADSGVQAIRDLADSGSTLEADILKLGHHGSNSSTDSVVLRLVAPKAAVISCGAENDYGHPHREVTSLLEKVKIDCLRTDLLGSVWAVTDGSSIAITTHHGQLEPLLIDSN
ncbi:MAG: MBL fold metallo-hydrolase [Oscillospiraceae bacterium]|nr:MBL fold metallo-hydrolase [Oscillospiraceae bacterium]